MAHGSHRDGATVHRRLRAYASRFRLGAGARTASGLLVSLAGALIAAAPAHAGPTVIPGNLVLDPSSLVTNALFPDKVGTSGVFARYGLNPWFGSFTYDTGTQFFGLDTGPLSDGVGGITSVCTPDVGFGSACSYFGGKVSASGRARAGVEYGFMTQGGSLDIRYPVKVTLDLPYGPGGTNVPRVGEAFTISSSWSVDIAKTLTKPGAPSPLAPMLASHGPTLQAFVDLIGELRANINAELCAVACIGDPFSGFDKGGTWEIAAANRNGDGQVRAFGQGVSPASPGKLMGGVIQYYVNIPTLDAQGAIGADQKTLTASAGDKVVGVGLGIDELVATLLGLPPLSDSFGISIGGEYLGVGYNLLEASAWMDLLVKQKLGFAGNSPTIELEFSGKVRVRQADGTFGPPTYKVSFKAGDNIELMAVDAQLLGVVPTARLFGQVSNKADLELAGSVSVSALGLDTPLGDIGPLFNPPPHQFDIGATSIFDKTFPVNMGEIVGGAFNMAFLPPLEVTDQGPNSIALTFWDKGQWGDPDAGGCAGLADCGFLPQSKVIGFYDLVDGDPLLGCLQRAGGCDADALLERLDFDRFRGRFFSSSPRLFGEEDYELFLGDLLALSEPLLDIRPGLTPEEIERSRAALQLAFGPQPFVVPPYPTPEPGSAALVALGLAGLLVARRRAAAAHA